MGQIFVLEGADGSGKTTAAKALVEHFAKTPMRALYLRDPGSSKLGEAIRKIVLDKDIPADPRELALIFLAAGRSFMRCAEQAAHDHDVVILDRCYLSNYAYRYAEGLAIDDMRRLADQFIEPHIPQERAFYLEISPELAEERLRAAGDRGQDRFESKASDHRRKVIDAYGRMAHDLQLLTVVDARPPVDEVVDDLLDRMAPLL